MTFQLAGKVVLVTGASSGIGREAAKAFARAGAKIALNGRNAGALEAVADDIRRSGGTAEPVPFDLADADGIPGFVRTVTSRLGGPVSVLVNSAGSAVLGFAEEVPLAAYQANLQINFFAPLALIKAVIPGMKRMKSGQIINVSSGVGRRGLPGVSAYCVSKFALNALTESIRVELEPHGIDVILFSPGLVKTGFLDHMTVFGRVRERFTSGTPSSADRIARELVSASIHRKRDVVCSVRTAAVQQINHFFPRLVDLVLLRKIRAAGQFDEGGHDDH